LTETSSRKTLDCPQASGPAALPSVSHKFNFACTVECQGPCTLECKLRERWVPCWDMKSSMNICTATTEMIKKGHHLAQVDYIDY
jgi:hypothetical protein